MNTNILKILVFCFVIVGCTNTKTTSEEYTSWPTEKANEWQKKNGWLVGCNYIPATAVNQLEMWQKETFDTATISKELKLASQIGFNVMRVFLHDLMWDEDSSSFLDRINTYLTISERYEIKTILVFFDDCWYGNPQRGTQPDPIPGLHNSGWVQSPSYATVMNKAEWPRLEKYMKGIITHFKNDTRIVLWDLYNEPANNHHVVQIFPLIKEVFKWARSVNPSQPLTICKWKENENTIDLITYCLMNSDIITFHNYGNYESMAKEIANLKSYGKPVLCSEYMARGNKSDFETILPLLKKENVGAVKWGFVDGKTQTKYPWEHPLNVTQVEPWHHEIFRKDLTPYRKSEVDLIKQLTKTK